MAKPTEKTHKEGAKKIKKEEKKLKAEAKQQAEQGEERLKLPAGGYQAGKHNCPYKNKGATHPVNLGRCTQKKHLGYCPQCYCLASYRHGCDLHGHKGEELLTTLRKNVNEQRAQQAKNGMLDPAAAAADGEAVNDNNDAAAHEADFETAAHNYAQVHGQSPANDDANGAVPAIDQGFQGLALENDAIAANIVPPANAPTDQPVDDERANVERTQKESIPGGRRATARIRLLVPNGGWQSPKEKGKAREPPDTEPSGTRRKSRRRGGDLSQVIAVAA